METFTKATKMRFKFATIKTLTTNLVVISSTLVVAAAAHGATVESTCYNLTGLAYSGKPVGWGQAAVPAGQGYRVGDRIRLIGSTFAGRKTFTVTDKIGYGSQLDLWHSSGSFCRQWGRRIVKIKRIKT